MHSRPNALDPPAAGSLAVTDTRSWGSKQDAELLKSCQTCPAPQPQGGCSHPPKLSTCAVQDFVDQEPVDAAVPASGEPVPGAPADLILFDGVRKGEQWAGTQTSWTPLDEVLAALTGSGWKVQGPADCAVTASYLTLVQQPGGVSCLRIDPCLAERNKWGFKRQALRRCAAPARPGTSWGTVLGGAACPGMVCAAIGMQSSPATYAPPSHLS